MMLPRDIQSPSPPSLLLFVTVSQFSLSLKTLFILGRQVSYPVKYSSIDICLIIFFFSSLDMGVFGDRPQKTIDILQKNHHLISTVHGTNINLLNCC
jgi:hypothetical protein